MTAAAVDSRNACLAADIGISMFRLLIADDFPDFRKSIRDIVAQRFPSMTVEEAADGGEVLSRVRSLSPHLIFMDINMPGRSGLELTRSIKADHPEICIVVLTSYDLPEYREAAMKYGANHFVSKGATNGQKIVALMESILPGLGFGPDGNPLGKPPDPGQ